MGSNWWFCSAHESVFDPSDLVSINYKFNMAKNNQKTIGINTLFMIPNQVGGTEYHLRSFLKYLEKLDKKNEYVVFCNKENFDTLHFKSNNWQKVLCPINAQSRIVRILYEQLVLPFLIRKYKCDIIHSYGYFGPLFTPGVLQLITVHDVNWRDHPEDNSVLSGFVMKVLIEANLRTAYKVVTDSEFGKSRLIHYFPQFKNKFEVIEPGVEDDFLELLKTNLEHPLGGKPYILGVSAFYPHKNIPYLLEIWKALSQQNKDLHLVLIGRNGKDEKKVLEMLKTLSRVEYYPKVSYNDLVSFYKHADLFIHPSEYEGFGYPVYEAVVAGKSAFVKNKDLYSHGIRSALVEFGCNSISNFETISRMLKNKHIRPETKFPTYYYGVKKLLRLINSYDSNS